MELWILIGKLNKENWVGVSLNSQKKISKTLLSDYIQPNQTNLLGVLYSLVWSWQSEQIAKVELMWNNNWVSKYAFQNF